MRRGVTFQKKKTTFKKPSIIKISTGGEEFVTNLKFKFSVITNQHLFIFVYITPMNKRNRIGCWRRENIFSPQLNARGLGLNS